MIQLTRLNNTTIIINSDLIKCVEQSPDTVITLLNGEKILVRESAAQILDAIVQFRRRVLSGLSPWAAAGVVPCANEISREGAAEEREG
jgi:flagellar protein FlbD